MKSKALLFGAASPHWFIFFCDLFIFPFEKCPATRRKRTEQGQGEGEAQGGEEQEQGQGEGLGLACSRWVSPHWSIFFFQPRFFIFLLGPPPPMGTKKKKKVVSRSQGEGKGLAFRRWSHRIGRFFSGSFSSSFYSFGVQDRDGRTGHLHEHLPPAGTRRRWTEAPPPPCERVGIPCSNDCVGGCGERTPGCVGAVDETRHTELTQT